MKRLSGRWSAPPALAFNLAMGWLLALSASCSLAAGEETEAAREAGKSSGNQIIERFGTPEKLRERITAPLTSDGTPMETVEGSSQFNARLFFPSSRRFLEIFVQPSGTGDLGTVLVGQDLDLDGEIDGSFQVPFPVSGVCANGVISCTPGSWQNCRYYLWTAAPDGRAALESVNPVRLGGCSCINNDCGSNLVWSNVPEVLKTLGGGVAGAIQGVNPGFTISDVKIEGTTITWYGQDTSRPTSSPETPAAGAPSPPPQAAYYSDPYSLPSATTAAVASQLGEPNSSYTLLRDLSDRAGGGAQIRSCAIRRVARYRTVPVEEILYPAGGGQGSWSVGTSAVGGKRVTLTVGRVGGSWMPDNSIVDQRYSIVILRPEFIRKANLVSAHSDDSLLLLLNDQLVYAQPSWCRADGSNCSRRAGNLDRAPGLDLTSYFQVPGVMAMNARVVVGDNGEGWAVIVLELAPSCEFGEEIDDGCQALESNRDCSLREETVDGVTTVRGMIFTGLTPLPSVRTVASTDGFCSADIARSWWQKNRTYLCETGERFDFGDVRTRFGKVVGTVNENGLSATFDDMRREPGGEWKAELGALTLPAAPPEKDCEPACKTRKPKTDTGVTLAGHAAAARTTTASWDFFYRRCREDVCPAADGEEIVRDCQCLNDFPEAATIMQVLRQAGQDTLCSDGVLRPGDAI